MESDHRFAARKEGIQKISNKQWLIIIAMGILGYYLSSLFDFIGLQYVSAGLERLILFLYPTFAVLINTYFFRNKLNRRQVIAPFRGVVDVSSAPALRK